MNRSAPASVLARLENLERAHRRLRAMAWCGATLVGCLFLLGMAQDKKAQEIEVDKLTARAITARSIIVSDQGEGSTIVSSAGLLLAWNKKPGPQIRMEGPQGEVAFSCKGLVFGTEDAPLLSLMTGPPASFVARDKKGNGRAALVGDGSVIVADADGRLRAVLGRTSTKSARTGTETSHPESTLTLLDAKGEIVHQVPR